MIVYSTAAVCPPGRQAQEDTPGQEEFDGRGRCGRRGEVDRDKTREVSSGLCGTNRLLRTQAFAPTVEGRDRDAFVSAGGDNGQVGAIKTQEALSPAFKKGRVGRATQSDRRLCRHEASPRGWGRASRLLLRSRT